MVDVCYSRDPFNFDRADNSEFPGDQTGHGEPGEKFENRMMGLTMSQFENLKMLLKNLQSAIINVQKLFHRRFQEFLAEQDLFANKYFWAGNRHQRFAGYFPAG